MKCSSLAHPARQQGWLGNTASLHSCPLRAGDGKVLGNEIQACLYQLAMEKAVPHKPHLTPSIIFAAQYNFN